MIKTFELSSTREKCTGKKIIIETDSSNVNNWMIKESNRLEIPCAFILASRFSSGLRLVKYSHILREGNGMTDALAKQSATRNYELVTWF